MLAVAKELSHPWYTMVISLSGKVCLSDYGLLELSSLIHPIIFPATLTCQKVIHLILADNHTLINKMLLFIGT